MGEIREAVIRLEEANAHNRTITNTLRPHEKIDKNGKRVPKKIYIAGPMRGYPEFNFPAFYAAAELLSFAGWTVFNPANRDNERHGKDISKGNPTGSEEVAAVQHGFSLREALRDDTQWITMEADAIYMLRGWEKSSGATAERALAIALHHEVIYEQGAVTALPNVEPMQGSALAPQHGGEQDPFGLSSKVAGAKLDAGKAPVFQGAIDYFPRALMAVAGVSFQGARKYTWKGWKDVPDGQNRYRNAAQRHAVKESIEGPYDLDFLNDPNNPAKVLHRAQVAWNDLAALELYLIEEEKKNEAVSKSS